MLFSLQKKNLLLVINFNDKKELISDQFRHFYKLKISGI